MVAIRVSDEELKADLEKLETYLSSLYKLNVNSSSKGIDMKNNTLRFLSSGFNFFKQKKLLREDLRASDIICKQNLK